MGMGLRRGTRLRLTHADLINLRDHLSPGDVQLIVVGKLELVEPDANHGTDLHVERLLLLTLSFL